MYEERREKPAMLDVDWTPFLKTLVASIVYSLIGILMFLLGFLVIRAVMAAEGRVAPVVKKRKGKPADLRRAA